MAQRCSTISAALVLEPLRQGHFDNLCSLYSIINGIRIASYPKLISHHHVRHLFSYGLDVLNQAGLLSTVMRLGIDERSWMRMSRAVVRRARGLTGIPLRRSLFLRELKPPTSRDSLALLKQHLSVGEPVLVLLWGAYNHCTVAVGHSDDRIILFDSCGFKWIHTRSFGLHTGSSTKRHQLARHSATALSTHVRL